MSLKLMTTNILKKQKKIPNYLLDFGLEDNKSRPGDFFFSPHLPQIEFQESQKGPESAARGSQGGRERGRVFTSSVPRVDGGPLRLNLQRRGRRPTGSPPAAAGCHADLLNLADIRWDLGGGWWAILDTGRSRYKPGGWWGR